MSVRTTIPAVFKDRRGDEFVMDGKHRHTVRLGSDTGYSTPLQASFNDGQLIEHVRQVMRRMALGDRMLSLFGSGVAGKRILNVGAGSGVEAVCLSGLGAASVWGTDSGPYKDCRLHRYERAPAVGEVQAKVVQVCAQSRAELWPNVKHAWARPQFVEDDITASRFPSASFDVVCSWATLEHILDSAAAWRETHRLLAPGGLAYHEYNPFFGLDGGHTLGTLDFPWGHVRLDGEDYARYLWRFRPDEADEALEFYRTGVNRTTLAGLQTDVRQAGFELCALAPRLRTEDLIRLDRTILRQCQRNYPDLTLNDLVCRVVRVAARKPE